MKNLTKRIISFSVLAVMTVGIVAAANWRETITVDYGVGITVDGGKFVPTDVNGDIVNPFIYNGTTYVPLRGVSQALGADVGYNASTNTAEIISPNTDALTQGDIMCLGMYVQTMMSNYPVYEATSSISVILEDLADYKLDMSTTRQSSLFNNIAVQTNTYNGHMAYIDEQWRSIKSIDQYFVDQLVGINTALARSGFIQVELKSIEKNLAELIKDPYNDKLFSQIIESKSIIEVERQTIYDVSTDNYSRLKDKLIKY